MLWEVPLVELCMLKIEMMSWRPQNAVNRIAAFRHDEVLHTPVTLDTSSNRIEYRGNDTLLLRELKSLDHVCGHVRTNSVGGIVMYHFTNVLWQGQQLCHHVCVTMNRNEVRALWVGKLADAPGYLFPSKDIDHVDLNAPREHNNPHPL